MWRIKKNDVVMVTSGKDKGKTAKVLRAYRDTSRVLLEGVNLVKKHVRRTQENQQGGIVRMERPISISNVMFFCKNCNRPVKTGFSLSKDGVKSRFCKRCKQAI